MQTLPTQEYFLSYYPLRVLLVLSTNPRKWIPVVEGSNLWQIIPTQSIVFYYGIWIFLSSLKDIKITQLIKKRILYFILSYFLLLCCSIMEDDPF